MFHAQQGMRMSFFHASLAFVVCIYYNPIWKKIFQPNFLISVDVMLPYFLKKEHVLKFLAIFFLNFLSRLDLAVEKAWIFK